MQFESVARPFEEPEGPGNGRLDGSAGGAPLETAASRDHCAPAGRRRCREPVGWYFKVDKKFTVAGKTKLVPTVRRTVTKLSSGTSLPSAARTPTRPMASGRSSNAWLSRSWIS